MSSMKYTGLEKEGSRGRQKVDDHSCRALSTIRDRSSIFSICLPRPSSYIIFFMFKITLNLSQIWAVVMSLKSNDSFDTGMLMKNNLCSYVEIVRVLSAPFLVTGFYLSSSCPCSTCNFFPLAQPQTVYHPRQIVRWKNLKMPWKGKVIYYDFINLKTAFNCLIHNQRTRQLQYNQLKLFSFPGCISTQIDHNMGGFVDGRGSQGNLHSFEDLT